MNRINLLLLYRTKKNVNLNKNNCLQPLQIPDVEHEQNQNQTNRLVPANNKHAIIKLCSEWKQNPCFDCSYW